MALSGFLIIDKPLGWTSRAAVDRAARWFPRNTRLGHCGTLDPLATGVLVLAIGQATRLTDHVQRMAKVYRAGIRCGARSDTDDAEGTITVTPGAVFPERSIVEQALAEFVGVTAQVPPSYSAAKIDGRRAYALARRGFDVDLQPRQVRIDAIELLSCVGPDLEIEVHCGKGTYIRSVARDLGERLGIGAYLQSLRRARIGVFEASAALPIDVDRDTARGALLDLSWGLKDLPRVDVSLLDAERLVLGQALPWSGSEVSGDLVVFTEGDQLVGAARLDEDRRLRPCKMFWTIPKKEPRTK